MHHTLYMSTYYIRGVEKKTEKILSLLKLTAPTPRGQGSGLV